MAWVSYDRVVRGTSVSGKFGESMRAIRKWTIRVDSPLTTEAEIIGGVTATMGITWGSPHPQFPELKALELELAPETDDGMRWLLTINYYIPPPNKVMKENGIPEDVWERSGGTTTVPAFTDNSGATITNAAGDPLEGLEKEREETSWTLTKYYESEATLQADIVAYAGKVNSGTWAGGAAKTYKAYFKSARKQSISKLDGDDDAGTIDFIESRWEFRYEPDTWKAMPWDVGFMELYNGPVWQKRVILGNDGKPVKQPVALNTNGTQKDPGQAPSVIKGGAGVDLYATANWATALGSPTIL
jgi:hypothetical protein